MAYVYCIKYKKNILYVGSTIDLHRRIRQHKNMLKNNKHSCYSLQKYVNDNNIPIESLNFITLEKCSPDDKLLLEKEYFIRLKPTCFEKRLG